MMFRRPHATFRLSLFLSICLLLLVAGCAGETPKQEKNSRPVPVRVVALERGNLPYELLLSGELIAPERAVIAPTVSGRISRLRWIWAIVSGKASGWSNWTPPS
jgi:multidrug efflux pump subunit AcrA (membrane-fusion protein)